jgi:NADPH:quinone reductase
MKTKQIVLAARPKGVPKAINFRTETIVLPNIKEGEVLLKANYFSVDPYMRGRMNDAKSYAEPFKIDNPINGGVTGTIMESKSDNFKVGDSVVGMLPWQEQCVVSEKALQKIDISTAPESYYLSVLGMTGLTAYFGLMHIGKPKKGETVVVSGAAGAVGIVVGQIAKIQGCRVIGIAGSDKKVNVLIDQFGFDQAINYKTTKDLRKDIAKACPDGVDIYFDNVGGEVSDAVIDNINFNARIALCGQISLYNSTEIPVGPRIQPMLLTRSVLMQGFIVGNFSSDFPEGMKHLSTWVKEGKIKFKETIENNFDNLPAALIGLFKGENTGKMIVKA